jgi:hypothetical protein
LKKFIDDAKTGKDIATLIAEITEIAQKVPAVLQACGVRKFEIELPQINSLNDLPACMEAIGKLVTLA